MGPTLQRRDWFKAAAAAALPLGRVARGQDAPRQFPGMVVRTYTPRNLEFPFSELKDFLTPKGQHYVRNHFAEPALDAATHTITVEGEVETPLTLTLADLKQLGEAAMPLTLECGGNGRSYLSPPPGGLLWGLGGVSTAEWAGTPVAAVLARAKPKPGATHAVLIGADKGAVGGDFPSPGVVHYDRGIPLAKLLKPECLLATRMNGDPLPAHHGAPVRAVLGGWYGMASVKWLTRVVVLSRPYDGYWQTKDYSYFERTHGLPTLVPAAEMQPKASIARPVLGDTLPVDRPVTVAGAAWAGDDPVDRVEVSGDGGRTWAAARFTTPAKPYCWRLWEFPWTPTRRGPTGVVARATTAGGKTQPTERDPDRRTYMINHLIPVEVVVR